MVIEERYDLAGSYVFFAGFGVFLVVWFLIWVLYLTLEILTSSERYDLLCVLCEIFGARH